MYQRRQNLERQYRFAAYPGASAVVEHGVGLHGLPVALVRGAVRRLVRGQRPDRAAAQAADGVDEPAAAERQLRGETPLFHQHRPRVLHPPDADLRVGRAAARQLQPRARRRQACPHREEQRGAHAAPDRRVDGVPAGRDRALHAPLRHGQRHGADFDHCRQFQRGQRAAAHRPAHRLPGAGGHPRERPGGTGENPLQPGFQCL